MSDIDTAAMRRGACPTLSAPMRTGDGLLARVALTAPATPKALAALCAAAIRHGSGLIDISARGNLQARGLTEASALAFAADVRTLGLPLRDGIAIDTGPLAGLDPSETTDPRPLAEAIRRGAAECDLAPGLAPKTAVVVDGGGRLALSALLADIRLRAVAGGWLLFTGGAERPQEVHGLLTGPDAAPATLALLARMAGRGRLFRGKDFTPAEVRASLGARLRPTPAFATETANPRPFGSFSLRGGLCALGAAPAFGQIAAKALIGFLDRAEAAGATLIRPAPGHGLLLIGPAAAAPALAAVAQEAGFIARPDDPRAAIAACPGAPACASAVFDTRSLAEAAAHLPGLADGSFTLHISGCAKGCAHPEPAGLTLAGQPEGVALILAGKASATPLATFSPGEAAAALAALSALVARQRHENETAAQCLGRLGPADMAEALAKGMS